VSSFSHFWRGAQMDFAGLAWVPGLHYQPNLHAKREHSVRNMEETQSL